jgi:hypothetical protein
MGDTVDQLHTGKQNHRIFIPTEFFDGGVLSLLLWSFTVDELGYYVIGYVNYIAILINEKIPSSLGVMPSKMNTRFRGKIFMATSNSNEMLQTC